MKVIKRFVLPEFPFSNTKGAKFDLCHNIGEGHPRVIIYINFVILEFQMLHTKLHGNLQSGSREEFTLYGDGGQIWSFRHLDRKIEKMHFSVAVVLYDMEIQTSSTLMNSKYGIF